MSKHDFVVTAVPAAPAGPTCPARKVYLYSWKCKRCFSYWASNYSNSLDDLYKYLEEKKLDDCEKELMKNALE